GMGRPPAEKQPKGALRQVPEIDLDFDLSGCEATWTPADGGPAWVGWLPHLDLQVARAMTAGSAAHDALWKAMEGRGELTLRCKLDLVDMLRPAVQPGSQLDYEYPPEKVTLHLDWGAYSGFFVHAPDSVRTDDSGADRGRIQLRFEPKRGRTVAVEFRLESFRADRVNRPFSVSFSTNEDKRPRPLQLHRVLLPWADTDLRALGREAVAV